LLLLSIFSSSVFAITDAQLFAWAAATYPQYFSGTPTGAQFPPYDIEYYPGTQNILAVNTTSGKVFGLGAITGDVLLYLGKLNDFAPAVTAWNAAQSNPVSATATTTAQNLTAGTAMASFTPLTATGGTIPYTFSYTGTLPSGLSFNASTGAVTGTPTAVYAAANLVFSVKDANNVVASTTSTASFTVVAAPAVQVAITGAGTESGAAGNVTFNVAAGNYTNTINNFVVGDSVVMPAGVQATVVNSSFTDGAIILQWTIQGQMVQITLTGLTNVQDTAAGFTAGSNTFHL
jgi:hypothetical protein